MSFTFKYLNQPIFNYNASDEELTCIYCQELYGINCHKIKHTITNLIKSKSLDWDKFWFRCIKCDLNNPTYPFKRQDTFILNDEQKSIVEELYQQILITSQNDYVQNLFLVTGFPGTGKTSVITYLLKYEEFKAYKICFSAPTNKALQVLIDKLDNKQNNEQLSHLENDVPIIEDENKWTFKTVFKLLNNKMNVNEKGDTTFEHRISDIKFKVDIIVLDEVSMVEEKQLNHLFQTMDNLKKNRHMEINIPVIIFLGDNGQLPPVSEDESIIFNPAIQKKNNIKCLSLTKIMRSKDRITDLSIKLRDLIPFKNNVKINQDINFIDLKKYVNSQIKYFDNKQEWINNYAGIFKDNLNNNESKSNTAPIILVYTNSEGEALNNECRKIIFNQPKEKYVPGELLVFSEYYCIKRYRKLKTDTDQKTKKEMYFLKFYTSDPIILENVIGSTIEIGQFSYLQILRSNSMLIENVQKKIQESSLPNHTKEFYSRLATETIQKWTINTGIVTNESLLDKYLNKLQSYINQSSHQYDIYQLSVDGSKKLDPLDTDPKNCQINTIRETSLDDYTETLNDIKLQIKQIYEFLSKTYKNNPFNKFLIDYIFQQIWLKYYYQSYVWPFAKVVYGYAVTTHKVQGSTYENIYVNIPNILGCKKVGNAIKMKALYTAMTRASKFVNVHYFKPSLLPVFPETQQFICQLCRKTQKSEAFSSINCTFDRICCDQILSKIKSTHLYTSNPKCVILSDRYKNLYSIPKSQSVDIDITDAYNYIKDNQLQKNEIDKYQYSNICLAKSLL